MSLMLERLLIIDDDRDLCDLLTAYLKTEGFELEQTHDGKAGIAMVATGIYRLLILDVMLPGRMNGLMALQTIRIKMTLPILMLSAKGDEIDRVVGLEMGADDYLAKPFNPRELAARIRTILRRSEYIRRKKEESANIFECDDIKLDVRNRLLYCAGNLVHLTPLEFDILTLLIRNAGEEVTRESLAKDVFDSPLSPYDRSIDVHVSNLRKKLGKRNGECERIKSIRSSGYIYTMSQGRLTDNKPFLPEKKNR